MGALFGLCCPDRSNGRRLQFLLLFFGLFGRAFGTVHPVDQAVGHGQQDEGADHGGQCDATEDGHGTGLADEGADEAGGIVGQGHETEPGTHHQGGQAQRSQLGHHGETDGREAELAQGMEQVGTDQPEHGGLDSLITTLFLAVGFLFMIGAVLEQGGDQSVKTSMFWLVGAYLFHTLGELCLSPIGLSMVTKLAPLRLASLMMGAWFGFVALANYIAGFVGSFVGESGPIAIFGGIAIAAVISALILLTMANRLVYWMHGAEGPAKEPEEHDKKLQSATV